jgi:hypothetical protein
MYIPAIWKQFIDVALVFGGMMQNNPNLGVLSRLLCWLPARWIDRLGWRSAGRFGSTSAVRLSRLFFVQ